MTRVYVRNFRKFGVIRRIWVAHGGYAYIDYDNRASAEDAIRSLNGKNGWWVRPYNSKRGCRGPVVDNIKCYLCGRPGHFARNCQQISGSRALGSGRRRSPSRQYRRNLSYGCRS